MLFRSQSSCVTRIKYIRNMYIIYKHSIGPCTVGITETRLQMTTTEAQSNVINWAAPKCRDDFSFSSICRIGPAFIYLLWLGARCGACRAALYIATYGRDYKYHLQYCALDPALSCLRRSVGVASWRSHRVRHCGNLLPSGGHGAVLRIKPHNWADVDWRCLKHHAGICFGGSCFIPR